MRLREIMQFDFDIELLSGTRIGGSGGGLEIGGEEPNLCVLRDPATGEPYIPGSTLKGKLRSEAERRHGMARSERGSPCMCGELRCRICPLFGAHFNQRATSAPTRIVVRDAKLTEASRAEYLEREAKGASDVETKTENIILRWDGVARHPRVGERVLPGTRFRARVLVHIYDVDTDEKKKEYQETIEQALGQIAMGGAIGSSGSRGYGEVKIHTPCVKKLGLGDLRILFTECK